jgi:L-histidine Nalpha-methyltransferase
VSLPRELAEFQADVLAGLARRHKAVSPKYFYDDAGSALFDRICEQPEYYLTRAELEILRTQGNEIAEWLGPRVTLVELGSGNSGKTRLLLDVLADPHAYVPVEISSGHLITATADLRRRYPALRVVPLAVDFMQPFALPPIALGGDRVAAYFPGSTIGNCEPVEALALLSRLRQLAGPGGVVLVGVDTRKDVAKLEAAYNDARGVTAEFNRNLLRRIDRELDADFDPEQFEHVAHYDAARGRIQMHLRSRVAQTTRVDGHRFRFARGENLHTENSYKYAAAEFAELARCAGLAPERLWRDSGGLFTVHGLRA